MWYNYPEAKPPKNVHVLGYMPSNHCVEVVLLDREEQLIHPFTNRKVQITKWRYLPKWPDGTRNYIK